MAKTTKERADKRFTSHVGDLEIKEQKTEGMKLFISQVPGSKILHIQVRAESEDGMIGDIFKDVSPDQKAFGLTYDELFENLGELII